MAELPSGSVGNTKKINIRHFSVDDVGFFEGPEKLLEVWFKLPQHCLAQLTSNGDTDKIDKKTCSGVDKSSGLRIIPRSNWNDILNLVRCEIITSCHGDGLDAYLLSESSMFISKNRFILKTCGTTTLLYAIEPLVALVQKYFHEATVMDIFYSHYSFQKPLLQQEPHRSFEREVQYLDGIFEGGAAYALGRINGDTWYLYTARDSKCSQDIPDQTLEILMTDLDPDFMSLFSTQVYSSSEELLKDVGLSDLIPGSIIDSKIFEPCGYSLNAIVKDDTYFTVHVTPQTECSWVSFETNLEKESYSPLISKVLGLFKPGKCVVSLFASKNALCGNSFTAFEDDKINGYKCNDRQFCVFSSYNLTFVHYSADSTASWYDQSHITRLQKGTSHCKAIVECISAETSTSFY